MYCHHPLVYRRRITREVRVGCVGIGANNPIRIQSMTTSPTMDTAATVNQIISLSEAGCEIVRLTVPSIREAENLKAIREQLRLGGCGIPLVADIHYTPNAALKAVEYVEKIRINPGNFADKKQFAQFSYSDDEYQRELERIDGQFRPLAERCRELGVAMRIGVNHGSLSDRIMSRYGDTPEGMVQSAVEFIQIAGRYGYHDLVLSMKASNPKIMISAYRLLAARLHELNMPYPFHLGVTEAGEGEDGRVKSAVGIGSLLEDGIGDTIRVSLTEDSVNEIPAAKAIADKYHHAPVIFTDITPDIPEQRNPFDPVRRDTPEIRFGKTGLGGHQPVAVFCSLTRFQSDHITEESGRIFSSSVNPLPDAIRIKVLSSYGEKKIRAAYDFAAEYSIPLVWECRGGLADVKQAMHQGDVFSVFPDPGIREAEWNGQIEEILKTVYEQGKTTEWFLGNETIPEFLSAKYSEPSDRIKYMIHRYVRTAVDLRINDYYFMVSNPALIYAGRYLVSVLGEMGVQPPVALRYSADHYPQACICTAFHAPVMLGSLLSDGIGDAVCLEDDALSANARTVVLFNILQASRARISKAEWISCPSCGRTQFDIQSALARIKAKTGHLTGVKIAVMGCVVNGPGEMADADFGFVGSQPGKVNLYVGKELVRRNVDFSDADQQLLELIRENGLWKEPAS